VRELHDLIRENSKDERDYGRYVQSMRGAKLTSFYTPEPIVRAIGSAIADSGIKVESLLDPSVGIGIFPENLDPMGRIAETVCIEKDLLTSKVLSALYPEYHIITGSYQNTGDDLSGRFDVVASNIPFGNFRVYDSVFDRAKDPVLNEAQNSIHNYYFIKGVQSLREGGLLAFVTTQGVMNSPGNRVIREWLMHNSALVSAVRLPNNLFKYHAGTEVATDLILLQKRTGKKELQPHESDFITTRQLGDSGVNYNNYFKDTERVIMTQVDVGKNQYGQPALIFTYDGTTENIGDTLTAMLREDMGQRFDMAYYESHKFGPAHSNPATRRPPVEYTEAEIIEEPIQNRSDEFTGAPEIVPLEEPSDSFWMAVEEHFEANPPVQKHNVSIEAETIRESDTGQILTDEQDTIEHAPDSFMHYASVSTWRLPKATASTQKEVRQPTPTPQEVQSQGSIPVAEQKKVTPVPRRQRRIGLRGRKQKDTPDEAQLELFAPNPVSAAMPERVSTRKEQESHSSVNMAPCPYTGMHRPHYQEGTVVIQDGQIGALGPRHPDGGVTFFPLELNATQQDRLIRFIPLRDTYLNLYEFEAETHTANDEEREQLNKAYDLFHSAFGDLNKKENLKLFLLDPAGEEVLSLERFEDGVAYKADIFKKPVAFITDEVTEVETVNEALAASLNRFGTVNLEYMNRLCGIEANEIINELRGRIFFNPLISEWEIKDKFVSGNVIEKIKRIEMHLKTNPSDPYTDMALDALVAAIPERITYEELDFNLGERWIPMGVYSQFASYLFDAPITINYSNKLDAFDVQCERYNHRILTEFMVKGESRSYNGIDLMEHALLNTVPQITKAVKNNDGNDFKVPDGQQIQLADTLITRIRTEFTDWLDVQKPEFKQRLCDIYNDKFNCFVRPRFDGSHQYFPGLDMASLKKHFGIEEIYDSQKDVVWMLKQNGGGVCDHEVGTGKTLTMCIAAMEMKRLGLAHKPMIIGLKANAKEIAKTFRIAYPNARVLYPGENDFTPNNRRKLLNDIKNNDYDCVVLTHDQFARIPQSPTIQQQIYEDEINDIDENLNVLRMDGVKVSNWMLKGLEIRKKNLEAKLSKLTADLQERRDEVADFGKMGIDHIFVDESHQFKNLMFNTRHSRVAGLGNSAGSQRASNLLFAIRTIQERTGKDLGATFLSGTTISNSLTELYSIFKYLRPQALYKQDINCFDAWAAVFAKKSTDYEFSVTNEIIQKERFRYFIKVPELANFYNEITDYRTAESIGIDRPHVKEVFVNLDPSEDQREYLNRLVAFAAGGPAELIGREALTDGEETARMLLVTNYANKMSLDMRIIDQSYDDQPNNKASVCARNIAEQYWKYNEHRGTQFVFSDISVYNTATWNIYEEIKRKLVEDHGIPSHEIRFIQEATSEKKRDRMIEAMREGDIRIMFGSTQKLGTGVNAQHRCVAGHNLDCPWTPKDMRQRRGRFQRTGNWVAKNHAGNTVTEFVYATNRSLDSYKFGILTNKQLFIDQIKKGTLGVRTIDEGAVSEDGGMSYAEMAAITSGNTDLLELTKIDKKIASLESERSAFIRNKSAAKYNLSASQETIKHHEGLISNFNDDRACRDELKMKDAEGNIIHNPLQLYGVQGKGVKFMAAKLHEIEKTARTGGGYEKIGTMGAFSVYVRTEHYEMDKKLFFTNTFSIGGTGKVKYSHNNGIMPKDDVLSVTSFIKALDKIEGLTEKSIKTIADQKADLPILQKVVDNPFSKEAELQALRVERDTLDRKVQQSLKPIREEMNHHATEGTAEELADRLRESIGANYGQDESTRRHIDNHIVVGGIPKSGTSFKM
jgi:N12 class adenine-specific DNA methylase